MLGSGSRLKTLCALTQTVLFICYALLGASSAAAQNVLLVGNTSASPGDANVTIRIDLSVDQGLSLLRFNLTFNAAFCGAVANRGGDAAVDFIVVGGNDGAAAGKDIVVRHTGLVTATAQEATGQCQDGSIDFGVFDVTGNPVISAGQGAVFELTFDVKADAGVGTHTLTLDNMQAEGGFPPKDSGNSAAIGRFHRQTP